MTVHADARPLPRIFATSWFSSWRWTHCPPSRPIKTLILHQLLVAEGELRQKRASNFHFLPPKVLLKCNTQHQVQDKASNGKHLISPGPTQRGAATTLHWNVTSALWVGAPPLGKQSSKQHQEWEAVRRKEQQVAGRGSFSKLFSFFTEILWFNDLKVCLQENRAMATRGRRVEY